MNQISGNIELEDTRTERIIRTGRHHRWQRVAHFGMFPADGLRYIPDRIDRLGNHGCFPQRGFPTDSADANGIGLDHGDLPFGHRRKIEQAL